MTKCIKCGSEEYDEPCFPEIPLCERGGCLLPAIAHHGGERLCDRHLAEVQSVKGP